MRPHLIALTLLVTGCAGPFTLAQDDYQPAAGPLLTRFAKDVSPRHALPEYPRPQMVRKDWLNLNGLWQYAVVEKAAEKPAQWQGKILVPYPIESALSGVMKPVKPDQRLWYTRQFTVPADWAGRRVLLHFGAVDWEATVFLNGQELGTHRGGYDGFSFDIGKALTPGGAQELVVSVWDPTNQGKQPRGKQVLNPGGIMYTPTTGIWQTVWLEPLPPASIERLRLTPDVDAGVLRVTATVGVAAKGADELCTVEAVALEAGTEVARATGAPGAEIALPIKQPKLWSPDNPFLYDLKVTLKRGGQTLDAVDSYFGMRKIAIAKDEQGVNRLMLNGKFVFQVGPLDQGFWPDGLYTAATDEALKYDVEITRKLGFNATRKHVKVEPDRWYYWCDKLGLLVWQDMPGSGVAPKADPIIPGTPAATQPARRQRNQNNPAEDPVAGAQFEKELKAMIDGLASHPSIIMWVVFNEGWGQHDTLRITNWVKQYDPSRLANCASGWTDFPVGDVIDVHSYPGPGAPKPNETRAGVLGEFGGLGLAVEGHTWTSRSWGYRGVADGPQLTRDYLKLLQRAYALKDSAGLNACIYTQITDVETECNGLLTYDRAQVKGDLEKLAAANRGNFPPAPVVKVIVPTAQKDPVSWRYTTDKPADDWFKPGFDAAAWKEGPAGFGTSGTPGTTVRTTWRTGDIWIRREVELPKVNAANLVLLMHHDEDAEVYLNGVLAAKPRGHTTDYEETDISKESQAALKEGRNVIAVHCHQTQGGQYIDVGIVELVPR